MEVCTNPWSASSWVTDNCLAGCVIIASEPFVHAHKLENQAIEIIGQSMHTDGPVTFESGSAMEIVGFDMTRRAAEDAFAQAGEGNNRDNVGVVELHGRLIGSSYMRPFDLRLLLFQIALLPMRYDE